MNTLNLNSNYIEHLSELDQEEQIKDQLEYTLEDVGIGPYEYWGSKEFHSQIDLDLTTDKVMVQYDRSYGDCIDVVFRGTILDYDSDLTLDWVANLVSVEWDTKARRYMAIYEVAAE